MMNMNNESGRIQQEAVVAYLT